MINEALDFLLQQLNEFILMKTGYRNVVVLQRLVTPDGVDLAAKNRVVLQLISIEEERVGKAQLPVHAPVGSNFPVRNPELKLNLSLMLTALGDSPLVVPEATPDKTYGDSIRLLSMVIRFFQFRHFFSRENSPSLPSSIDQLIVELHPVSLENQNYLWASLGVKYRPSVVYKVRLVTVFEDSFTDFVGAPTVVDIQLSNNP